MDRIEVYSDEYFMKEALKEAQLAAEKDEIPVGAVIVLEQKIIARAHNLTERLKDVTAHAEMQAITAAAEFIGAKYLKKCTLYVTLEPCVMCAGALSWSQIDRIVYGADDLRNGAQLSKSNLFHPKTKIEGGLLKDEAAELLNSFFQKKRK
ncbi:MAG: nucleoside deaminase [Flavobacteriales bacterium]|nr:nucleoside deaminase [Flavobacteriales bacterium]